MEYMFAISVDAHRAHRHRRSIPERVKDKMQYFKGKQKDSMGDNNRRPAPRGQYVSREQGTGHQPGSAVRLAAVRINGVRAEEDVLHWLVTYYRAAHVEYSADLEE
jgi:hypothetical protein